MVEIYSNAWKAIRENQEHTNGDYFIMFKMKVIYLKFFMMRFLSQLCLCILDYILTFNIFEIVCCILSSLKNKNNTNIQNYS